MKASKMGNWNPGEYETEIISAICHIILMHYALLLGLLQYWMVEYICPGCINLNSPIFLFPMEEYIKITDICKIL